MTSAAGDLRYYGGRAVSGSLARDLDWEVRERELRHAGELPRRREAVREQPKVRTAVRVQVREKQHLSVLSAVGFAAVAAAAVLGLLGYGQRLEISAETVALKTQLATLETENVTLTTQYEQMYDLATVKEAAEAAGMSKPSASQVYYIDLSDGDRAVVYQKEGPSVLSRLLSSLHHGVYAVVEYFE